MCEGNVWSEKADSAPNTSPEEEMLAEKQKEQSMRCSSARKFKTLQTLWTGQLWMCGICVLGNIGLKVTNFMKIPEETFQEQVGR